ncbi:GH92 family glycosyl hydrolase [Paenibacillus sp. MAH-36]|uniref:GH92 family glycosyl hydrolase n=1 Tax=Paenibacillus violae TaxID=3077234 RepID=A0ABU3R753_9BACL|nr:GH92 family glycosyl hydrolase [Paenibacillus sp. PFR10]MDU0200077.1 GH92 family glycosyl hydrolase [Paenibacillus sp. PFR10]
MNRKTFRKSCSLLLSFVLLWSMLFITPAFEHSAEAAAPSFHAGFESTEAVQPNWEDETEASHHVSQAESKISSEMRQSGKKALLYAGKTSDTSAAYAYNKVFEVNIPVKSNTTLSYWIYPQSHTTLGGTDLNHGKNSTYVAVDLAFEDGTYLHSYQAVDQHGVVMSPEEQGKGNQLAVDIWNFITSNVGSAAAGKTIKRILISYEQSGGNAGTYRGFIDDIQIRNSEFDPSAYANPLLGSQNNKLDIVGFGGNRGNTFPGAVVPFGMIQWSPDTGYNDLGSGKSPLGSGYDYDRKSIAGFSLTHIDGPGCDIAQDIPFLPVVGKMGKSPATHFEDYASPFQRENEIAIPGYYSVLLDKYNIKSEFTATERTSIGRFTYPASTQAMMLINTGINATGVRDANIQIDKNSSMVTGYVNAGGFCGTKGSGTLAENTNNYTVYFAAEFSQPFTEVGTYKGSQITKDSQSAQSEIPNNRKVGGYVRFDTSNQKEVYVKVAISYTDMEHAKLNLKTENPGWNFESVKQTAQAKWKTALSKIQVTGGTEKHKRMLYSFLYHSLIHPNVFSDVNGDYRGFDQKIYNTGGKYTHYSTFSGWDVYRTQMQLIGLLFPDIGSDIAQSFVDDAKSRSGFLPKWSIANSETNVMNGDPASITISNMYAFGARNFDLQEALKVMNFHASTPSSLNGRFNLADYLQLGYIPIERGGWVTGYIPEYNNADFAIAQFAKALGDEGKYNKYLTRSQSWRLSFKDGYIQPRLANGNFESTFDPASEHGFQEANSAQYTWVLPFDYKGLFEKMGGLEAARARLDFFFQKLNAGSTEPYSFLGNQPSYGIPWAYNFAGQPWKTQEIVRKGMLELFHDGPAGLIGNNDLGAGSAWFVLAALGLYPSIPGIGGFSMHAPLFEETIIQLNDCKQIRLIGNHASEEAKYIQDLKLNGHSYDSTWLPYEYLKDGAVLDFTLGTTPNTSWATTPPDPLATPSKGEFASQVAIACSNYTPMQDSAQKAPDANNSDGAQPLVAVMNTKEAAASEAPAGFSSEAKPWRLVQLPNSNARYKEVNGR